MFNTLQVAILSGGYQLPEMVRKIDTLYGAGRLTGEEREQLLELCVQHMSPESQRPELLTIVETLAERMTAAERRLDALEGNAADTGDYPDWQPWDGISKDYQPGAIVRHDGKLWQNVAGIQNTYEPGTLGTDRIWVEYTQEE